MASRRSTRLTPVANDHDDLEKALLQLATETNPPKRTTPTASRAGTPTLPRLKKKTPAKKSKANETDTGSVASTGSNGTTGTVGSKGSKQHAPDTEPPVVARKAPPSKAMTKTASRKQESAESLDEEAVPDQAVVKEPADKKWNIALELLKKIRDNGIVANPDETVEDAHLRIALMIVGLYTDSFRELVDEALEKETMEKCIQSLGKAASDVATAYNEKLQTAYNHGHGEGFAAGRAERDEAHARDHQHWFDQGFEHAVELATTAATKAVATAMEALEPGEVPMDEEEGAEEGQEVADEEEEGQEVAEEEGADDWD